MSNIADIAAAAPNGRGKLDELMLAMDVVDTLRHREDLVERELDDAGKQEKLLENLRRIYREQGIEVPDRILKDGVAALRDSRFTYTPPGAGLKRTLATLYVRRGALSRRLFGILAALGIGWGAYQFLVVQPERQAETEAATELSTTLPARLATAVNDVNAVATDEEARTRAATLKADAERALRNGDRAAATEAIAGLTALRADLVREYVLTIVSRPGASTGVWRRPPRNPQGRNHYLIVEAIAPGGQKLALPIRNEETGATETVTMFGVRVPEVMFDAVVRDKQQDGIVQHNRFAVKRRGTMTPEYLMPFEGGMITKW